MFGYVTVNAKSLPEEQRTRFKSHYCGLCHVLGRNFGNSARMTLSYDMTFLAMLLNSLYEPDENPQTSARCPARPWKRENIAFSSATQYAAEMNIAYAYFKARDDVSDENKAGAHVLSAALKKRYGRVRRKYPEKCLKIEQSIRALSEMEKQGVREADPPANAMAELFGEVYAWKDDFWAEPLRKLGGAIGRFVYLCDAYEDRAQDEEKGQYNPLSAYAQRPDYELFVERILTMVIAEGADAFEILPLEKDAEILKNVLYSGVWSRYGALKNPQEKPTLRQKFRRRVRIRKRKPQKENEE